MLVARDSDVKAVLVGQRVALVDGAAGEVEQVAGLERHLQHGRRRQILRPEVAGRVARQLLARPGDSR